MDEEILKNIWNTLTNDGATKSDFETWKSNFSGSEEIQDNVHAYLTDKKYTKSDIETWRTNVGIATSEKKNQVDTPSTSNEVVTESTTETETTPGFSDGLEVEVEEEFNINIDAPNRKGVQLNDDGSVSTHKMKTETFDGENWFSFPTVFQNEDGEFVDMSEQAESDWKSVYEEAKKRGEVADFGTDKESAFAYGEGSWKERYDSRKNKNLLKDDLSSLFEKATNPNRERGQGSITFTKTDRAIETKGEFLDLPIDEQLKLKIEADPNIQKALAIGYVKQSDINSALKGNKKSIEKLQEVSVKSIKDNALKLQEEKQKEYSQYSDVKNFSYTPEEKEKRNAIIKKVKDFDAETARLVELAGSDASVKELLAIIQIEDGAYTDEEFDIFKNSDYEPTGFEDDVLGKMYDQQKLKKLSGDGNKIDIAGFNGYLIENGFKERYAKLLENETISEDGRYYDYSGNYNPTLAAERLKYNYLKNYLAEVDLQNVNKQVLEYEIKNEGKNPFLNGDVDKIDLKPAIAIDELRNYMEEEFPTLSFAVKKQKAETKENYQRELEGGAGGSNTQWLLDAGSQGGRSVNDRINSFSEWTYDWLGMESVTDEIQMNQAETELNRDDMLRYTYASGKSAFANGREYMIDDNGEIYDLDLKIRVSSVLEPEQIKEIRKQVQLNGVDVSSFSGTGATVTTAGVPLKLLTSTPFN